jgi:tetratricopeptide (TPR) repeat protein
LSRVIVSLLGAICAFAQASDYDQGVARFEHGDPAGAVPFLLRAVEARPKNAQAWKALGVAYAAQRLYRDAERPLARACELDRTLEDACYFYARALYALDRFDASLQALRRANPNSWKVQFAQAQALEALGRAGEAERDFRRSLESARGMDPGPSIGLGLFLVRQGRGAEAIPVLENVLTRFPNSADAHTHLGRALLESGRLADSIPHLERAVALAPTSAQAHLLLAKAYVRAGRAEAAQEHFDAAAKLGEEK